MTIQGVNKENIPFWGYAANDKNASQAAYFEKTDLYKTFWVFVIGSAAGFLVETIWCLIKNGRIECRSSMIIGPFTAIYGFGALVLYFGNHPAIKNKKLHIFAYGAAVSTIVEYLCSLFQEILFGSVSWDYSRQPFNIDGRISLLYSVFWGLLAILWFITIRPMFEQLISKIPLSIYKPLTWGLAVFIVIDVAVSIAAVTRWGMRLDGIPSANMITAMLDSLFPNEFMEVIYPNMLW